MTMAKTSPPCVVSIAGTDPSGGAGVQADIKAISATGSYAAAIITVLVAQNTCGVQAIYPISADFVTEQMYSVFDDLSINVVKIGMLYSKEIIELVATFIEKFAIKKVVLDPVMVAKNGCELIDLNTMEFLQRRLFPLSYLITPNLWEAEKIVDSKITSQNEMEAVAKTLGKKHGTNFLIKGGHLMNTRAPDVLYSHTNSSLSWFYADRIKTLNTHGTGCTLSSAIASYLAQKYSLEESITLAKKYLTCAIQAGSFLQLGQGCGPVDHFFFLRKNQQE